MSARSAQICVDVMSFTIVSLETKLSVVPGRYFFGQIMADAVGVLMARSRYGVLVESYVRTRGCSLLVLWPNVSFGILVVNLESYVVVF